MGPIKETSPSPNNGSPDASEPVLKTGATQWFKRHYQVVDRTNSQIRTMLVDKRLHGLAEWKVAIQTGRIRLNSLFSVHFTTC